jgi:hypothetical protein
MSDSSNLSLPYLAAGQAQKHVTLNESLRRLDAIVQLGVVSATTAAQPASPVDGSVYILPAGKSGADWSGMANGALAYWRDGSWEQVNPREGWLAWARDSDSLLVWTGTAWTPFNASLSLSSGDRLLGRVSAGAGPAEEIVCTAAGRELINDADAAAQRTTLGLGTAATRNTGASGAAIPLLSTANTWSEAQTFGIGMGGSMIVRGAGADSARLRFFNNAATSAGLLVGQGFFSGSDNIGFVFNTANADLVLGTSNTDRVRISADGGLVAGAATGGSRGPGTINATAVFDDNALLTCYVIEHWLDGSIDLEKWDATTPDRETALATQPVRPVAPEGPRTLRGAAGENADLSVAPEADRREVGARSPDSDGKTPRQHLPARGFATVAEQRLDIDRYAGWVRENRRLPAFPGPDKWREEHAGKIAVGDLLQRLWETVEVLAVHAINARDRELRLEKRIEALEDQRKQQA